MTGETWKQNPVSTTDKCVCLSARQVWPPSAVPSGPRRPYHPCDHPLHIQRLPSPIRLMGSPDKLAGQGAPRPRSAALHGPWDGSTAVGSKRAVAACSPAAYPSTCITETIARPGSARSAGAGRVAEKPPHSASVPPAHKLGEGIGTGVRAQQPAHRLLAAAVLPLPQVRHYHGRCKHVSKPCSLPCGWKMLNCSVRAHLTRRM